MNFRDAYLGAQEAQEVLVDQAVHHLQAFLALPEALVHPANLVVLVVLDILVVLVNQEHHQFLQSSTRPI